MGKRLNALPEVAEAFPTCRDGKSPVNQEIVTSCDEPPLDDSGVGWQKRFFFFFFEKSSRYKKLAGWLNTGVIQHQQ